MTGTQHMSLSEALRVIAAHHPHWHIWRTDHLVWGTRCLSAEPLGSGTTLDAPTPELLDHELARFEHKYGWPA